MTPDLFLHYDGPRVEFERPRSCWAAAAEGSPATCYRVPASDLGLCDRHLMEYRQASS